jgi:predicted HNH restriction endonuclease
VEIKERLVLSARPGKLTLIRTPCIRHYGFVCQSCGFDFEKTYGELGKNFIHVHHIRSLER